MDKAEIAEILESYDLGIFQAAEPLDNDPRRPWKVSTDRGEFVVREGLLGGSPEDFRFEHGLADWLGEWGFPISQPLATRHGDTWVEIAGKFFAVYHYQPGEPFTRRCCAQAENAGTCLAGFHERASGYAGARTRRPLPGYRSPHQDAAVIRERWPHREEIRELLESFEQEEHHLFDTPLPEALLFHDFSTGNVIFVQHQVSGVFDLDCCAWGPRLIDLANSVLWFSLVETGREGVAEHQDELDKACAQAFVTGYEKVCPLTDPERRRFPMALRWQIRRWALFDSVETQPLGHWNASEWDHSRGQIILMDAASERIMEL